MVAIRKRLERPATRADLGALPASVKGEIIDGELYVQPRPRPGHSRAGGGIYAAAHSSVGRGHAPGGWWIFNEPGIELPDAPEISPDVAGWRRERLPWVDPAEPIRVVPDWVCEVLSPSNSSYDRRVKFPFYARKGVGHLWVVEPRARTVEIKRLVGERWLEIAVFAEDEVMRAEPFEALEIPLSDLWLPAFPPTS